MTFERIWLPHFGFPDAIDLEMPAVHVLDVFGAHRRFFRPRCSDENISFRRAYSDLTWLAETSISPQGDRAGKLQLAPES